MKKFEYIETRTEKILVKCYCLNEKKIVVEDGVTTIGPSVFQGSSAEEIVLPDSVVRIHDKAFAECHNLEHITIGGKHLQRIGEHILYDCPSLQEISFTSAMDTDCYSLAMERIMCVCENYSVFEPYYDMTRKGARNMDEVFSKKRRKMTRKFSLGEKSVVLPYHVTTAGRSAVRKIIINTLMPNMKVSEDNPFSIDYSLHFLMTYINNTECRFLTAMELWFLDKDENAKEYLTLDAMSGCEILAKYKEDKLLTEFVKFGLMGNMELNYALQLAIDNGLTASTACILDILNQRSKFKHA